MYKRRIFTVDEDYFPLDRMRQIVDYLHSHDQHFGTWPRLMARIRRGVMLISFTQFL